MSQRHLKWSASKSYGAHGVECGFPLPILRVSLEIFAFVRRLACKKSVAQPLHSLSAILAGSGMAQVALISGPTTANH